MMYQDYVRETVKENKKMAKQKGWTLLDGTYGKALEIFHEGRYYLRSYETIVCSISVDGEFKRHWDGYSRTTANHINQFLRRHGQPTMNKKEWENTDWYSISETAGYNEVGIRA